jgi:aquaporin NIP
MKQDIQNFMAELIGTFILVFFGCTAILVNESSGNALGHIGVAFSFGIAVMTVIFAVGHISGAHINPAVTIGLAVIKRISFGKAIYYIVAQILGALIGAILLKLVMNTDIDLAVNTYTGSSMQAFLMEMIMSAFLVFMVSSMVTDTRASSSFAAIAIGSVIAIDALVGGPITGASMNPARSLAPAIISGQLQDIWVYITAPILGGVIGSSLYCFIGCRK